MYACLSLSQPGGKGHEMQFSDDVDPAHRNMCYSQVKGTGPGAVTGEEGTMPDPRLCTQCTYVYMPFLGTHAGGLGGIGCGGTGTYPLLW